MNLPLIFYLWGLISKILSGLLLLPAIVGLVYQEYDAALIYALTALATFIIGLLLSLKKPKNTVIYEKEGLVSVAGSWVLLSFVGAVPLCVSGDIPAYIDALFEIVSGFTTTGASVLADVESLTHAGLFWRSFSHFIGGMGILLFMLSLLPSMGGSSFQLMKAESPGPSVGKMVPKLKTGALILYALYTGMTVILFIFLLFGKLPVFDSMLLAFGTAGTGGFSIINQNFSAYSDYVQIVVATFMLLYGVNFNLYFLFLIGKPKEFFKNEELRFFIIVVAIGILVITFNILSAYGSFGEALKNAYFQVAALVSSTGFSSADFNQWPLLSKTVLLLMMFMGACAGSTGGGFKVSRVMILLKSIRSQFYAFFHPHGVKVPKMEGQPLSEKLMKGTWIYLTVFGCLFLISTLLLSFDPYLGFEESFTGTLACINNIGPGLGKLGPASNYGALSVFSKIVCIFDMLAGRLELYPMLVFILPLTWKGSIKASRQ